MTTSKCGGKYWPADVVAKAEADGVRRAELLQAMFDVGYFPPNTRPSKECLLSPERYQQKSKKLA